MIRICFNFWQKQKENDYFSLTIYDETLWIIIDLSFYLKRIFFVGQNLFFNSKIDKNEFALVRCCKNLRLFYVFLLNVYWYDFNWSRTEALVLHVLFHTCLGTRFCREVLETVSMVSLLCLFYNRFLSPIRNRVSIAS